MKFDGFIGPADEARSPRVDTQKLINLYPEKNEVTGEWALYSTPGTTNFATGLAGAVRCLWAGDNRLFAVAGDQLYEIYSNGTNSVIGTVTDDGRRAYILPNGNQLAVISGGALWIATGTTLVFVTFFDGGWSGKGDLYHTTYTWKSGDKFDATMVGGTITIAGTDYVVFGVPSPDTLIIDFAGYTPTLLAGLAYTMPGDNVVASSGTMIDTYFIVSVPGTQQYNISQPGDGLRWSKLDFGSKEGYPDHIAILIGQGKDLYLIGTQTSEIHRDTGKADFPFEPVPGGMSGFGTPAPDATVVLGQGIALLAGNQDGGPTAYHVINYQPQRVSTSAIEYEWSKYSTVADAFGFSYTESGHLFWQISFPTAGKTWVYDATAKAWHQRAYGAGLALHKARCHAFVFGKHLVGDYATGTIYQLSSETTSDAGTGITRVRRAPHISKNYDQRNVYSDFKLGIQDGPTVTLSWSNDAGTNWTTPRAPDSARLANNVAGRVLAQIWRRLGSAYDRVFELVVTGSSKVAIFGAWINDGEDQ